MDQFFEETIESKNQGFNNIMYIVVTVCMVIFGIVGIMGLVGLMGMLTGNFNVESIINTVGGALGAYVCFRGRGYFHQELDYTLVESSFQISRVLDNRKRVDLLDVDVADAIFFGPVDDPEFEKYQKSDNVKTTRAFLNKETENLYGLFLVADGKKRMIIMEPSVEMVRQIRQKIKRRGY